MIIFSEILYAVIVKDVEEFSERHGALALRAQEEREVAELSAETAQILWSCCSESVQAGSSFQNERIQGNCLAVVLDCRGGSLVVDIYDVMMEILLILLRHFRIKFLELFLHPVALDLAVQCLVHLSVKIGHILYCHIGVGICL